MSNERGPLTEPASKRQRSVNTPAWPELRFTGPGGVPGEEYLRALGGEPEAITGIICTTMGLNASWLLKSIGLPDGATLPALIAAHHPERCWAGRAADRRVARPSAVPGFPGATLIFPPFADAPNKRGAYEHRHSATAPRGLLGCVHSKIIIVFRDDCVRVAISTANLTRRQWADTRNHTWSCDYERAPTPQPLLAGGGFGAELAAYLAAMLAPCNPSAEDAELIHRLALYDFRAASERDHVQLVTSRPGIFPIATPAPPPGACGVFRSTLAGSDHHRPSPVDIGVLVASMRADVDADGMHELVLDPQPSNQHDAHAVAVKLGARLGGRQVGWLPRHVAGWVAPLIHGNSGLAFGARVVPEDLFSNRSRVGMQTLLLHVSIVRTGGTAGQGVVNKGIVNNDGHRFDAESDSSSALVHVGRDADLAVPLVHLLAKLQRPLGLCRMRQLLRPHAWPAAAAQVQKAYWYASSSVGNVATADGLRFVNAWSRAIQSAANDAADSAEEDDACWALTATCKGSPLHACPEIVFPSVAELRKLCEDGNAKARMRDERGQPRVGGRVRIVGLTSAAGGALNGKCGTLVDGAVQNGRWCVRVDGGGAGDQRRAVRPANLEQGPPLLPWCFQFTDKTWDLLQRHALKDATVRRILRDCEVQRFRVSEVSGLPEKDRNAGDAAMQHSKIAMRWWDAKAEADVCGWVYVGSHNFSPAAWGLPLRREREQALSHDGWTLGAGSSQQIWMANWEAGVIRIEPPQRKAEGKADRRTHANRLDWRRLREQLGFKPGEHFGGTRREWSRKDAPPPAVPATNSKRGGLAREYHPRPNPPPERPEDEDDEASSDPRPEPEPEPGEPLREVVVGVHASCEWRPFQRREAGATDMQLIEERRVDDGDEGMLSLLNEQARLGRTEAESGESYARLLALM